MANFTYLNIHAGAVHTTVGVDTSGASLIVLYASGASATAPGVSDNKSNVWTPLTSTIGGGTFGRVFYCINPTVGTGHTFTVAEADGSIFMQGFSFTNGTFKPDKESGTAASGISSIQPGSVSPTDDNELLVCGLSLGFGTSPIINSSFTATDVNGDNVNFCGGLAYKIQTTKGAENPTWSWTSNGSEVCIIESFTVTPVVSGSAGYAFVI